MKRYLLVMFLLIFIGQQLLAQTYNEYSKKGLDAYDQKKYTEAIDWFTKSIEVDKMNFEGYSNRGYTYMLLKEFDKAESDLNAAVRLAPDTAYNYKNRSTLYDNKGNTELAIADITKYISLKPKDYAAYDTRGNLYKYLNKDDLAIADFDKSISLRPDYLNPYIRKAFTLSRQNRTDEGIKVLTNVENDTRLYAGGVFFGARANLYIKVRRYEQALEDEKKADQYGCTDWKSYADRAIIESYLKMDDEASASLKKAVVYNKNMKEIYNYIKTNRIKPSTGCIDGECETGVGTYLFPSGNKYIGGFNHYTRQGQGICYFANGDRFEGTFANNEQQQGTYTFANGYKYIGSYDANGKELNGTYYATNGNSVEMRNGVMVPLATATSTLAQNSQMMTCPVCNGLGIRSIAAKGTTYSTYTTPNSYSIDRNGNTHVEVYGGTVVLESHDFGHYEDCQKCHGKGVIPKN